MLISNQSFFKKLIQAKVAHNESAFRPVSGFSLDSRSIVRGEAFFALKGKHCDGHDFIAQAVSKGACCIVAERYLPLKPEVSFFIVKDAYQALSRAISYIRKIKKPFVYAVTGSIGKTTAKEMLAFLLEPYFRVAKSRGTENNLLGLAKTIFSLKDEEILIVELGTNAPGEIETLTRALRPDVGILTFIKPVHLEGLKSLKGILKEKISLFKVKPGVTAVLNRDDPYLAGVKGIKKIYWFGTKRGGANDLSARLIRRAADKSFFLVQGKYQLILPAHKEQFIANALGAILGAHLKGIGIGKLVERMNSFNSFAPMRMQLKQLNGFFVINDAYNANPFSCQQALKNLKKYPSPKIAVIGDMLELGAKTAYYHRRLAPYLIKSGADWCLTLGHYTPYLNAALKKLGYRRALHFPSQRALAEFIRSRIQQRKNTEQTCVIFLKGSRKLELEKVLDYL